MALRVCLVTTFYPPQNFGGDGVHVERLAKALATRGHDVAVIHAPAAYRTLARRDHGAGRMQTPADRASNGHDAPGPGVEIDVRSFTGAAARLEPFLVHQAGVPVLSRGFLRRALDGDANGPFDVVHFHNVSLVGGVGAFAFGSGVKLFTAHEYWLGCPTHMLFRYDREICTRRTCVRCTLRARRPPQWWRYLGVRDRYLEHIDAMIFPSVLTESVYHDLGISRPAVVMPHFLPDGYRRAAAAAGRRPPGTPSYCLYVGRLDPVKGLEDAASILSRDGAPMPLWIAGQGPQGDQLRRRYGSHPTIRFLGHQSGERLAALYRDAAAVILPSAGLETFGQVILEAFAHGTPAISSRHGAGREIIEASGAGYTYETAEELNGALTELTDPARREALGNRGLEHLARAHAEAAYVQRYEALVEELRG